MSTKTSPRRPPAANAPAPLRFTKMDEGWWRAFRDGQIFDLYAESGGAFRATVANAKRPPHTIKTFPAGRGAWTQARLWLEAGGPVDASRLTKLLPSRR